MSLLENELSQEKKSYEFANEILKFTISDLCTKRGEELDAKARAFVEMAKFVEMLSNLNFIKSKELESWTQDDRIFEVAEMATISMGEFFYKYGITNARTLRAEYKKMKQKFLKHIEKINVDLNDFD